MMMRAGDLLGLLWIAVLLCACTPPTDRSLELPAAITTTRSTDFALERSARIAVDPAARISLPGEPQLQLEFQLDMAAALSAELRRLGFVVGPVTTSDFLLGYAVAVDTELSDDDIEAMFGLAPGYGGNARQIYQRGTLLLDLHETQSRKNVWRGALQTELIEDLTPEQRRQRIEIAVARLLQQL